MRFFIERRRSGQGTVEAALLIPTLFIGILMLVQPGLVLYDRIVMQQAAADGCRLLETLEPGNEDAAKRAIERHLSAVPQADVFHSGDWDIQLTGSESSEEVSVSITNKLRPLPLIGAGMGFLGLAEGGLFEMTVDASLEKDQWVAESEMGLSPSSWVERWEDKV